MKKLTTLITTAALCFVSSCQLSADTISIRADEWFPMNGEPDSGNEGYMIDLAREIFGAAGHKVDYKLMPWERAVNSVRAGKFDCVVGAYPEDAPDFKFPTENWGIDSTGYFVRPDSTWTFNGYDSLLTQKVGVISGYAYGDEVDELIKSRGDVFKAASGNDALEKNFKKLTGKRLDLVIESIAVGNAKIKEMNLTGKIKLGGKDPSEEPIYIACSPAKATSAAYIKLVDEGTRALRASGKLQQIMSKYGLSDWK